MTTQIDRYQILSELGRGGMAIVYRAYDPQNQRQVALKVLPREYLHEHQFRARFQREIEILTSFRHPAVVPIYGYGQFQGQPYLVMQFMNGGSLEERLKRKGVYTLEETTTLLERLAPALEAAHQQQIIHRDLKPSNILFDEHRQAYIADFGIARLAEQAGRTKLTGSLLIGTPAYMSPEQAKGGVELDGRSDVYALGVIVFELLTGKLPFEADTPMQLALKHLMDPIPDILAVNPNLPNRCKKIVMKALAKKPEERYATPSELVNALKDAAQKRSTPFPKSAESKARLAVTTPVFVQTLTTRWGNRTVGGLGIGIAILVLLTFIGLYRTSQLAAALADPSPSPLISSSPLSLTPSPSLLIPSSPLPPTPTRLPFTAAQAGISLTGEQSFTTNQELRAGDSPLELLIYHQEDVSPPGYLYAFPNSVLRFDSVNNQSFQVRVSQGSRVFIETGNYVSGAVQPANVSGLTFKVEGSCMAVETTLTEIVMSCYEGTCTYDVFGGVTGSIPPGEQVMFDLQALTTISQVSILEEEAQIFASLLPADSAAQTCALQYVLTPTPTLPLSAPHTLTPTRTPTLPPTPAPGTAAWTPSPTPTITSTTDVYPAPPTKTPTKTPSPTVTNTFPPDVTPPTATPTPSPIKIFTPTKTPTPSKTPTPTISPTSLPPSKTPTPTNTPVLPTPTKTSTPQTPPTPIPTFTPTNPPTSTKTKTPIPTDTPTLEPTDTPTP